MPEADEKSYQILLEKVPDAKQPDTALFLSGCFSLPPASTRGIAASGPIAILSDLTRTQADLLMAELSPSVPAGVELRIAGPNNDERVSRLQWPRPPRIYGRELSEFVSTGEGQDLNCPICGGLIRISRDGGVLKAAIPSDRKRQGTEIRPAPSSDNDPLFSGVKPLATGTDRLASIRSLQAGDTGFWMDYSHSIFAPPAPAAEDASPIQGKSGETSNAKKSTGRIAAGLAAFMKPGAFSLVLGRTKDAQIVKIVSEIMGISESDARDKCLNLGLCVARDISLDEAQNLLARFRNLGARARIVKPL